MQSIVCYDSRSTGGMDLTDKELSQLTWEATYHLTQRAAKNIHLVTIFDCCHAGGNTKEAERDRGIDDGIIPQEIKQFYGHEWFDRQVLGGKVYYSPKRGNHLQLAASGEKEKAKERVIDGKNRGLYTYQLLDILQEHQAKLSYTQLQHALYIRLQNETNHQTPQSDSLGISADHHPFLHLGSNLPQETMVVSYQKELDKWLVPWGHIQGINPNRKEDFRFFLPVTNSEHSLEEVYLSHAALDSFVHPDLDKIFLAEAKALGIEKLAVGIEEVLQKELNLAELDALYWRWGQAGQIAPFQVKKLEEQICILQEGNLVYRTAFPQSLQASSLFTLHLERIAKWQRVLAITNNNSRIKKNQYQVEWYKVEGADGYPNEAEAPSKSIAPGVNQAIFPYTWDQNYIEQQMDWLEPAFRLRFTNKSGKTLYLSGLYLQADFKVTDRFCPYIALDSGKSIDFQYRTKSGRLYQTIFLSIYPELLREHIHTIKEYIKLFISYKPFDLEQLKQDGLYSKLVSGLTASNPSKGIGSRTDHLLGGHRDWTVETLELSIQKPKLS